MACMARKMSLLRVGLLSDKVSVACFAASSTPPLDAKCSEEYDSALALASLLPSTTPLTALTLLLSVDRHHGPSFQPLTGLPEIPCSLPRRGDASFPFWTTI